MYYTDLQFDVSCILLSQKNQDTLVMGQEELAGIVNSSRSQVKRALMKLRQEGGIMMQCRKTVIVDIAVIEKYVSENIQIEERKLKEIKK